MSDHPSERTQVAELLDGYVTCALWSSTDQSDDSGGEPLDANHGPDDLAPEAVESMRRDCVDFLAHNRADLELYAEQRAFDASQGSAWAYAGHDFWLTRNHHGAGFWDRGLGELGDRLTNAAHAYGESDLYIGDDERIYVT